MSRIGMIIIGGSAAFTAACTPISPDRIPGSTQVAASEYETLASDAARTSDLGGVAVKTRGSTSTSVTLSASSGSLTHNTGAFVLDDGTYVLRDPDGASAGGLWTDGASILVSTPANGFSTNYDYVRVYNQSYVAGTTPVAVQGVVGIVTRASDMPAAGSAVYTGEAEGTYSNGTTLFDLDDGTSTVIANFSSGAVTVRMQDFRVKSRRTGQSALIGFDGVQVTGATISGNSFTGGAISTRAGSTPVAIIGSAQQSNVRGRFYGQDSAGDPDEVGGIAYLRGADGSVTAIFVAD